MSWPAAALRNFAAAGDVRFTARPGAAAPCGPAGGIARDQDKESLTIMRTLPAIPTPAAAGLRSE